MPKNRKKILLSKNKLIRLKEYICVQAPTALYED